MKGSKWRRVRLPASKCYPGLNHARFRTIECVFAWEDKFRRVLVRYEVISDVQYAFKTLAYTMINLRHFCHA